MCLRMVAYRRLMVLIFLPLLHSWLRYASTCSSVHSLCIRSIREPWEALSQEGDKAVVVALVRLLRVGGQRVVVVLLQVGDLGGVQHRLHSTQCTLLVVLGYHRLCTTATPLVAADDNDSRYGLTRIDCTTTNEHTLFGVLLLSTLLITRRRWRCVGNTCVTGRSMIQSWVVDSCWRAEVVHRGKARSDGADRWAVIVQLRAVMAWCSTAQLRDEVRTAVLDERESGSGVVQLGDGALAACGTASWAHR